MNDTRVPSGFQLHHLGCAVSNLDESARRYGSVLGGTRRRTRRIDVASQSVAVCFVELAPTIFLELVQPTHPEARLQRYMSAGFYHLAFLVDALAPERERLTKADYVPLKPFASEAFDGRLCEFFLSPEGHLVELVETTAEHFGEFFARVCEPAP